jgi:hypothetical protein
MSKFGLTGVLSFLGLFGVGSAALLKIRKRVSVKCDYRQRVVAMALREVGTYDPSKYWLDAYGYVPDSKYSWCGVFALWVLRQVGLVDWKWRTGKGFIYEDGIARLPITESPDSGDVAYYDQPYQHYAIVERVIGDRVSIIAGNTPNVSTSQVQLSKATAYYSIEPLLPSV